MMRRPGHRQRSDLVFDDEDVDGVGGDPWRLSTTTNQVSWPNGPPDEEKRMARTPIHPGEHLAEELEELGVSAAELARQLDVPVNRVTGIINGQRGVTADTALRLGHWFGTSPEYWLNLQKL